MSLNVSTQELYGLQVMKESDLKLLTTWLDTEQYRHGRSTATSLPWIWTVGPFGLGTIASDAEMTEAVQNWTQEGMEHQQSRINLCIH